VEGVNVANPPPISEGKLPFAQVFGLSDPQMHLQQVSFSFVILLPSPPPL
jgi:hypothetical protein